MSSALKHGLPRVVPRSHLGITDVRFFAVDKSRPWQAGASKPRSSSLHLLPLLTRTASLRRIWVSILIISTQKSESSPPRLRSGSSLNPGSLVFLADLAQFFDDGLDPVSKRSFIIETENSYS